MVDKDKNQDNESKPKAKGKPRSVVVDYKQNKVPEWIHEAIATQLEIDAEDAKSAGTLGFMARALVIATMPYKDPKQDVFTRTNGTFKLRILAGYEGGIPYGIYPRLLTSWITTEAVRTKSPVLELGESLRGFMRDVLEIRGTSGGKLGTGTRVNEQMKRLFGSFITATYSDDRQAFSLRNVMMVESARIASDFDIEALPPSGTNEHSPNDALWIPQENGIAGKWASQVQLTQGFFQECVDNPVPIDLRAYKALRGSPLAMDVYTWLTYRLSRITKQSRPMPWESLMFQFGSQFNPDDPGQAKRDFKKGFLQALKAVEIVYPAARTRLDDAGLVLLPSPTHIPRIGPQAKSKLALPKTTPPPPQPDLFGGDA